MLSTLDVTSMWRLIERGREGAYAVVIDTDYIPKARLHKAPLDEVNFILKPDHGHFLTGDDIFAAAGHGMEYDIHGKQKCLAPVVITWTFHQLGITMYINPLGPYKSM